ncbi:hypothetical protein BV20DRAFT_1058377 [Pilatotrama ljubarskyi]|nr:hypothetical protein BV20DRAFT_1058377 [Pilatotrama ljubarskyi]
MPLRALHRFFTLLQQRENAAIIRDELWLVDVKARPISWTTDLEHRSYVSGNSLHTGLLDVRDDCWKKSREGHNNDGICVIDLTHLESPAYCFVLEHQSRVMTAYEYIRSKMFGGSFDQESGHHPASPTPSDQQVSERLGIQLKVPLRKDMPMSLDVLVSLYLGFTSPQELDILRNTFDREDEPHIAIGKAILPPYDGDVASHRRLRTSVIHRLLHEERAFQFVFEPEWPIDNWGIPPYSPLALVEKLHHWNLEMERRTGGLWPILHDTPWEDIPQHVQILVGLAQMELQPLLQPSAALKLAMRTRDRIDDSQLPSLYEIIGALDEFPFLDLARIQLTASQVVKVLREYPGVEALSLSYNHHIRADDIPIILAAAPSLKRLHMMGFYFPAAFAFRQLTRASAGPGPTISMPFFTPERVVRALNEILPLALQEHRFGETLKLFTSGGRILPDFEPWSPTPPSLSPDTAWSERPVVSLPLQYGSYSRGQCGTWVFLFDWDHTRHRYRDVGKNAYAFVHYQRVLRDELILTCGCPEMQDVRGALLAEQATRTCRADRPRGEPGGCRHAPSTTRPVLETVPPGMYHFAGEAYDLRGFLRCMADEGRPLPSPASVALLEGILDARDAAPMERICRLVPRDEVPHVTTMQRASEIGRTVQRRGMAPDVSWGPVGQGLHPMWIGRGAPGFVKLMRDGMGVRLG